MSNKLSFHCFVNAPVQMGSAGKVYLIGAQGVATYQDVVAVAGSTCTTNDGTRGKCRMTLSTTHN